MEIQVIIRWLNQLVTSYFEKGPENRVFLFFDPSGDFSEIIDHLKGDFEILKGDGSLLEIKYKIEIENPEGKFVLYLPFANKPENLSYLREYLYTGKVFSDTLYIFLKKQGVDFPTEKKKISEIKKILPSLALKSIGAGEDYWDNAFDSSGDELALPDFSDRLFDFIKNPTETFESLISENKMDVFRKKIKNVYGFESETAEPELYRYQFFAQLCFTEAYIILGEPEDYPFQSYVCEKSKVEKSLRLIKDIRHQTLCKEIYYDLSSQLERNNNLGNYAREYALNPDIETFKVFDLEAIKTLDKLAEKCETKQKFLQLFSENSELIRRKSEGFWGKQSDIREWIVLVTLDELMKLIEKFTSEIQNIDDEEELIWKYCDSYFEIDRLYRKYITDASELDDSLENVYDWIEKFYLEYLDQINSRFSEKIFAKEKWKFSSVSFQGDFLRKLDLKDEDKKVGIIVVDGLRYEIGKEIVDKFSSSFDINISPMYAQIPTDTVIGMAAMLSPENCELDCDSTGIKVTSNGTSLNNKDERLKYLKSKVKKIDIFNLDEFNNRQASEIKKIKNPVILFLEGPDKLLEAGGFNYLHLVSRNLSSITKAIKKLFKADFSEIHILSDHGFLTFNDPKGNFKIEDKPGFTKDSRRFACGEHINNDYLVKFEISGLEKSGKMLYFPRSIYYFRKDSFLHGGISIHEAIIPHIEIKNKGGVVEKLEIQVEMEKGISNRIFQVKIKPKWAGLETKPRTVEILAYHENKLISNKPAIEIESKEESVNVRILPDKEIEKGEKIRVMILDQETGEILNETELETLIYFEADF